MNLEKLMYDFVDDYIEKGTFASKEELLLVVNEMKDIINNNKDKTPEEIIDIIIRKPLEDLESIRQKYPTPGYTSSIRIDNINVKLYGGNINYLGEPMPENALFDIASMTKFYTIALAYCLIKEGAFSYNDKVKDLDSRFVNMGDLTVGEVLSFGVEFMTPGRIDDGKTIEEAKDKLFNMEVKEKGKYNYNDMGMMLIKEVMENVTGEDYADLMDRFILKPFGLKDTHLIVPQNKFQLLTGSPNAIYGKVNDPKAIVVGGYSGHAGMWASSDDITKFMNDIYHNGIVPNISDAYTAGGLGKHRGVMGSTFPAHPKGLNVTYLDVKEPSDSFVIQGSTRAYGAGTPSGSWATLFNPASMSLSEAEFQNFRINVKNIKNNKNIVRLVKQFEFDNNGQLVKYDMIDARSMLPEGVSIDKASANNAKLGLQLRFLNHVIKAYDENYTNEINVTRNGNAR